MKKSLMITIVIILALVLILLGYFIYSSLLPRPNNSPQGASQQITPINVTEETLPSYLALTNIVQDMPSGAEIALKTSSKSYVIKKGSAVEGTSSNPDIVITIPSSYIPKLSNGFCEALSEAKSKGALGIELKLSKTALAWKYRSMFSYRSCLGF